MLTDRKENNFVMTFPYRKAVVYQKLPKQKQWNFWTSDQYATLLTFNICQTASYLLPGNILAFFNFRNGVKKLACAEGPF